MSYTPSVEAVAGRLILGRNLRSLRQSAGLTQEALALQAGLDRSFLVDLEAGRHSCMLDRIFDLAAALDVAASDLIADS